jgi:hypothetical protein
MVSIGRIMFGLLRMEHGSTIFKLSLGAVLPRVGAASLPEITKSRRSSIFGAKKVSGGYLLVVAHRSSILGDMLIPLALCRWALCLSTR